MRRIISFSEVCAEDDIGGKAKNLALLFQSRFPVPHGFVITAEAAQPIIRQNQDSDWRAFNEPFRQEIEAAFKQYIQPPAVVRSSCSAEDLEQASFAGQYETVLNVTEGNLLESIQRCLLSRNQNHAQSYLTQRFPSGVQEQAMSIIVQELVDADAAGVIFSKNPITGNHDEIMINASFGLGEAVVSGLVTPDLFILSKQARTIVQMELGAKDSKVVLDREGTRIIETKAREKMSFSLQDTQLHDLMSMAIAIETFFGYPVDLEFAYRKGCLYILQARPITA